MQDCVSVEVSLDAEDTQVESLTTLNCDMLNYERTRLF